MASKLEGTENGRTPLLSTRTNGEIEAARALLAALSGYVELIGLLLDKARLLLTDCIAVLFLLCGGFCEHHRR